MKVYIAGPYTQGDVAKNVHDAIKAADKLLEKGHVPYIPHLTHFWHLVSPKPYQTWIHYAVYWLDACDAVLRLYGDSKGADNEVHLAYAKGKRVYYSIADLPLG